MKSRKNKPQLIQLANNQKEQQKFRKLWWIKQNRKCAILNYKIKYPDAVVDHKHKLKAQKAGPKGRGLVRGILHFQANSLEGVITKKFKRYGLHKMIDLPTFLRNMADYLENPPIPGTFIHWSEKPKKKYEPFGIQKYNKIKKHFHKLHPRAKMPEYPKKWIKVDKKGHKTYKGRLTKEWEKLLKETEEFLKS